MTTYAYRAINGNGAAISASMEAPTLNDVVLAARQRMQHVTILYELVNDPVPHFEQVLECPNAKPPEVITESWDLSALDLLPLSKLREVIKARRIEGAAGWFSSRIPSPPILRAAMERLRERIFIHTFSRYVARNQPETAKSSAAERAPEAGPFFALPKISPTLDFRPTPENISMCNATSLKTFSIVPVSYVGQKIQILDPSAMPASTDIDSHNSSELHQATSELDRVLDGLISSFPLERVRCSDNPRTHAWLTRKIAQLSYRDDDTLFTKVRKAIFRQPPNRDEELRGTHQNLPSLGASPKMPLSGSRFKEVIANAKFLESNLEDHPSSMAGLWVINIMLALAGGMDGIRIAPGLSQSNALFKCGEREFEADVLSRNLHEPMVVVIAAACGISPTELAPTSNSFEFTNKEGLGFRVSLNTSFNEFGEVIDLRWKRTDSSLNEAKIKPQR